MSEPRFTTKSNQYGIKLLDTIWPADCLNFLEGLQILEKPEVFDLTFFDPPFNQGKDYANHDDNMEWNEYWAWLQKVMFKIWQHTKEGGAIYFMHREKHMGNLMMALEGARWTVQNVIIWRKMTSATPCKIRYNKQYQPIIFATKGNRPAVFNTLRFNRPLDPHQTKERDKGVQLTDVWDKVRELTSGYLAGTEALRWGESYRLSKDGKIGGESISYGAGDGKERIHKQQAPLHLLLRIILSSTNPGGIVFDPFLGSGTSAVVAKQTFRHYIGCENNPAMAKIATARTQHIRYVDDVKERFWNQYRTTEKIHYIWGWEHE